MKQSEINKLKRFCPHGHEYTPENTVTRPDGRGNPARSCRACLRRKDEARREKKREELSLTRGGAGAFKFR